MVDLFWKTKIDKMEKTPSAFLKIGYIFFENLCQGFRWGTGWFIRLIRAEMVNLVKNAGR